MSQRPPSLRTALLSTLAPFFFFFAPSFFPLHRSSLPTRSALLVRVDEVKERGDLDGGEGGVEDAHGDV